MPAKKAPAKKKVSRRAAPAKKSAVSKSTMSRAASARRSAPVSKARKPLSKDLEYENLREDDELTSQYPAMKKNNFLSLIVLGVGTLLVIVGIYIQVNKDRPEMNESQKEATGVTTVVSATGDTPASGAAGTNTASTTQPYGAFPVDAQKMVEQFFSYFNQDQFDLMPAMYDNNFKTVPGLVQFFSPKRLQSRKQNIIGDLKITEVNAVIDNPIVQRNPNAMVVQYVQTYTLKQDGKNYEETWFAYVMKEGGGYKLNGFECQTNCAASPFFHLK